MTAPEWQPSFANGTKTSLERSSNFLDLEALDDIADLVAVEFIELDTALQTGAHFVRVVLEALERADLALVHHFLAATQASRGVAIDFAFGAYSVRSAAIGLIRVARLAGNQVASNAAAASTTGAIVNASGSSAPTL